MARLRADTLKAALPAARYYARVLPTLPPTQRGGWVDGGLCPFHSDAHKGNFRVNLDTGAYRCFSCDAKGGDIIDFHQQSRSLSFPDTITDLAREFLSGGGWDDA
ncbi:CHC2 zinc finger domain-containing protein [uncultured Lamprocystis sp.]